MFTSDAVFLPERTGEADFPAVSQMLLDVMTGSPTHPAYRHTDYHLLK